MTMTSTNDTPFDRDETSVYRRYWLLFGVLICCFTAWGVAADLTTPMVAGFKRIFEMNTFQASLVQLAYFGAYFLLAIPAALINERFGYKAGLLSGVLLAAAGAIAFYPASKIMTYEAFLVALFTMTATSISKPPPTRTCCRWARRKRRRADSTSPAFNAVGTNIGVLLRRHIDPAQVGRAGEHGQPSASAQEA